MRQADNSGREFFGRAWVAETLEKQGRKICGKILLEKFAKKFAGNFPKIRQTKLKNSPQIRSAAPRDQEWIAPEEPLDCNDFVAYGT